MVDKWPKWLIRKHASNTATPPRRGNKGAGQHRRYETYGAARIKAMAKKQATSKTVEALKHDEATLKNIPTAEYQSDMAVHQPRSV